MIKNGNITKQENAEKNKITNEPFTPYDPAFLKNEYASPAVTPPTNPIKAGKKSILENDGLTMNKPPVIAIIMAAP